MAEVEPQTVETTTIPSSSSMPSNLDKVSSYRRMPSKDITKEELPLTTSNSDDSSAEIDDSKMKRSMSVQQMLFTAKNAVPSQWLIGAKNSTAGKMLLNLKSSETAKFIVNVKNSPTAQRYLTHAFTMLPVFLLFVAVTLTFRTMSGDSMRFSGPYARRLITSPVTVPQSGQVDISVVVLTYKKYKLLAKLLPSIIRQKPANFEVIIVDNACLPETRKVVFDAFKADETARNTPFKYLPICDNPGYAVGNNKGVEIASDSNAKWIQFMNDDIVLQGESFFHDMMDVSESMPNAGGAVCKLLTHGGEELIEAGSIVWNDASACGIGRGAIYHTSPDLSYAKPVDYGSGACLMMRKDLFVDYKGFDHENFPNYYEDTDLQLHIQHDLGKEIWYQPLAVAYHAEHGSFNQANAKALMTSSAERFIKKWGERLEQKHLENPHAYEPHQQELQFMRASDLRARDVNKANILWLEQAAPNPENGSGFGRAFDNLGMVAELGHRITLVLQQKISASWCNKKCRDRITSLGVEMVTGDWQEYVDKNIDFYDIVYVSRPAIFQITYKKWQEVYEKHSFALIYDCEALWYKRDQLLITYLQDEKNTHEFPGGVEYLGLDNGEMDMELVNLEINHAEEFELNLIKMADSVIGVSDREKEIILDLLPETETYTIGHIMSIEESRVTKNTWHERRGILFLASFSDIMYYNGDSVWYFLTEVYPLVIKESKTPIPFTIAGRKIPQELYDLVEKDELLSKHVIFKESVDDIMELYNNSRIFIAPHLYGAGIQFKVSEAFSLGIPIVMSKFTADGFGIAADDQIGCVGESVQGMKNCILDINGYEGIWNRMRENELRFLRETHNRDDAIKVWDNVIDVNLKRIKDIRAEGDTHKMEHSLVTTHFNEAVEPCPEGERHYSIKHPDVKEAVEAGIFENNWFHYHHHGRFEGKRYLCFEYKSYNEDPQEGCPEGEEAYGNENPDVKEAVDAGVFESCWDHYIQFGKEEGKKYVCIE